MVLWKTVKLLAKSNAYLQEWLYSPVVCFENEAFVDQMRRLVQECFLRLDFREILHVVPQNI